MFKIGWGTLIVAIGFMVAAWLGTSEAHAGMPGGNPLGTSMAVASPWAQAPTVGFTLTGTQVTAAKIDWTPAEAGTYTVNVRVGNSSGSITVAESGNVSRTDTIILDSPLDAHLVKDVELAISQW